MVSRAAPKGVYSSDILLQNFTRHVDDHLFTQIGALGWAAPTGGELPLPSSVRARHAVGVDAAGRRHSTVVAQTTADLWTRTVTQWNILGDDGALHLVDLTGLVGEAVTF